MVSGLFSGQIDVLKWGVAFTSTYFNGGTQMRGKTCNEVGLPLLSRQMGYGDFHEGKPPLSKWTALDSSDSCISLNAMPNLNPCASAPFSAASTWSHIM